MDDLQMMQYLNTKVHNWGVKWTAEEDQRLLRGIELYGEQNWKSVSEMVGTRTSVKCVQRWEKVLRPDLVKGKWTEEEDNALKEIVLKGFEHWGKVAEQMTGRTSKQCRERWANYLDPSLIKTPFSPTEDETVLRLQSEFGNKWAYIARLMPGRTENSVKLRYHSLVKTYGGRNGINFRKTMNMMMLANESLPAYEDTSDEKLHPAKKPHLMKPQQQQPQQQHQSFNDDLIAKQSLLNPSFVLNNNTSSNVGLEQQMLFLHHQQQQQHMQHIQQLQMQHLNQHRNLLSPAALQMQQQQLLLKQQQNSHLNQMHYQQLQQQMMLQKQHHEMYSGILPSQVVIPSGSHQPYIQIPPTSYTPQQQPIFYPFSNQSQMLPHQSQQVLSQMKDNMNPNQDSSTLGHHSLPPQCYSQVLPYPGLMPHSGQSLHYQQESIMSQEQKILESSLSKQQQQQQLQHVQHPMVGFKNYTIQDIDNFIKHTAQKAESTDNSSDSDRSGYEKN